MNKFEKEYNEQWEKYQMNKNDLFPNIMLLGTSGAGKSSLINKIFGKKFADVGNVKPVTLNYGNMYKGKDCGCSVNLIDTAGYELGKFDDYYNQVHKVISDGIDGEKVHIIWYCISISRERVEDSDISILRKLIKEPSIRERVCIVFTKCDLDSTDGSTAKKLKEVLKKSLDYPFCCFETTTMLDSNLDLNKLIQWSADKIDDEDLYNKFIAAQMTNLEAKREAAQKTIKIATASAAAIGATPIPFSDAALLVPVQVTMVGKIIDIYGINDLAHISTALISQVVISNIGKSLVSSLIKIVPVVGSWVGGLINAGVASALTGAIGYATSEICFNSVRNYMNGKKVQWDTLFETDEFVKLIEDNFKQNKNK